MHDALCGASAALSAYSPLSVKLFGSPGLNVYIRIWFPRILILTRLLYNVHLWVCSARELAKLSAVYMRVCRRIAGQSRWKATSDSNSGGSNLTDLEVRRSLCLPSLDCILRKARLAYAVRLACNDKLQALRALLSMKCDGSVMPWAAQLQEDMAYMYQYTDITIYIYISATVPLGTLGVFDAMSVLRILESL